MRSIATRGREIVLPPVRGYWTEALYGLLGEDALVQAGEAPPPSKGSVLHDHDLQMALYLCYELHYTAIAGVPGEMEWNPLVLMLRAALEDAFEQAIRALVPERSPVRSPRWGRSSSAACGRTMAHRFRATSRPRRRSRRCAST